MQVHVLMLPFFVVIEKKLIKQVHNMSFGAAGQKFPMGGLGFEGQQGMGASPGGLMGNDMVMYFS